MRRYAAMTIALLGVGVLAYLLFGRHGSPTTSDADKASPTPNDASPASIQLASTHVPILSDDDPRGMLRLEGQVIDADDSGVSGATVTVNSRPARHVDTGGDGSFYFDHLLARRYSLIAVAGDLVGAQLYTLTAMSAPAIIRVREGSQLVVTVVEVESTKPIEGATVEVRGARELVQTTDATGRARFRGIPDGLTVVRASAAGHSPSTALAQIPDTPSAAVEQTIAIAAGAPVMGRVIDGAGNPVVNARVIARGSGEVFGLIDPWKDGAISDADGRFRIRAVSGGTWRFVAHHNEYPSAASELVTLDGVNERTGIVIELEVGVVLAGRVVDAAGGPAPWATVRVGPSNWSQWSGRWAGIYQTTAREDGTFEFRSLRREVVVAVATADNVSSESLKIDLRARGSVRDALLTLSVYGKIAGVVVDGQGGGVSEVAVTAEPDPFEEPMSGDWAIRSRVSTVTDGEGGFTLRGLRDGRYLLRASRFASTGTPWYTQGPTVEANTGDTDVKIVLEPEGALKGVLLFADGSHPSLFTVRIGPTLPRPGGDDGRFQISGIPGGIYDVSFQGPDFADKTVRGVAIERGDVADMGIVEVKAGRAVTGRVLGPDGRGVRGALVLTGRQLFSDGTTLGEGFSGLMDGNLSIRRTTTDSSGAFRITGISKRQSVIAAEHASVGRSLFIPLPAGDENLTMDLTLVPFSALEGTVTVDGSPAAGATIVAAQRGTQSPVLATADDNGTYVIPRLPAGEYQVAATVTTGFESTLRAARQVTITPGEDATLDIDIDPDRGTIRLVVRIIPEHSSIELAQVFLAEGQWSFANAKQLNEAFISGGAANGRWAIANDGVTATFDEAKPGEYSACVIPLVSTMNDPAMNERVQKCMDQVKVYCESITVRDAPKEQTHAPTVPPMVTLPDCDP